MKKESKIRISKEDAEVFTAGLGQIAGGSYKLILLADKQGVPQALGYESVRDWVNDRLGGYVRHPIEEREKIIDELRANGESTSSIARALGVTARTVEYGSNPLSAAKNRERTKERDRARDDAKNFAALPGKTSEKPRKSHESLPKDWGKPKPVDPDQLAEKGLELLVWDKVKDRFLPFWNDLLESLESDEAEVLPYVILEHAPTKPNI